MASSVSQPYRILERKRAGEALTPAEIRAVVAGAVDGGWSDAQLAAFLMAGAIRGFDDAETYELTQAMLESGERWGLVAEFETLTDKHSTGGVGDKVSLVLAPLLAACGLPIAMLTGRGLGHTGGTADKLEVIPGLDLRLDRRRSLELLGEVGMAVGIATSEVAPADRKLYALRDRTATVDSLPLITASILSKKLATGARAIVFDVKTGDGAFLPELDVARELAQLLVRTCGAFSCRASALLTDMSQPLGDWVGHAAEVRESFDCLAGGGSREVMEVTYALAAELAGPANGPDRAALERAIASGAARERFDRWALAQGAEAAWMSAPDLPLAPAEHVVEAARAGVLSRVATRRLGLLVGDAARGGGAIDPGVSLRYRARLGQTVAAGEELARLYLRRPDERLAAEVRACFEVADHGTAPALVIERVAGA